MKKDTFGAVRALVAAIALSCATLLGACSGINPEELIRADLTTNLELVKNADKETVSELMQDINADELEMYGIDGAEFATSLLEGFDYSIDSVAVEGDVAVAELSITCKSATTLYGELESLTVDLLSDPSVYTMTQEELYARAGELVMEALDETEVRTTPIEVSYTKTSEGWEMDDASSEAFAQAFL